MNFRSVAFIVIFTCFTRPTRGNMPATKGGGIVEKQVMKLPVKPLLQRLTNVAAYARVSSGKDAIYTHIKEEMLKKATVDLEGVFKKRAGKE